MIWKRKVCDIKSKVKKEDKMHSDHLLLRRGRDAGTCLIIFPVLHSHFVFMSLPHELQNSPYVKHSLLSCNAMQYRHSPTFQRNISPLYTGSKSKPHKNACHRLLMISCLAYSSILKMTYQAIELHGIITQETKLFRVTTVRT
jgi:hypothetical protein